jgi:hypothetical protein
MLKEHQQHIQLKHPDKSALTKHSIDPGHHIHFHNTSILATKTQYMDCIVREAIDIELAFPHSQKMEATLSSETSVLTRPTWRHMPVDSILHSHHCENLKSYDVYSSYICS